MKPFLFAVAVMFGPPLSVVLVMLAVHTHPFLGSVACMAWLFGGLWLLGKAGL